MLSLSSIASTTVFSCFMILLMQIILNKNEFLTKAGLSILLAVTYITAIRLLLPFELPFMRNLDIRHIWPSIFLFLLNTKICLSGYAVNLSTVLLSVWLLGMLLLIIREIFSYRQLQAFIKNCILQSDNEQTAFIDNKIRQCKKHPSYRLYVTDQSISPVICGLKNPCIIIPQTCLENDSWMYVLEHEVAHYLHKDLYFNLLCGFIYIIYWWNPFIYLLKKQHGRLLEFSIDSIVTKNMDKEQKTKYLESLLEMKKSCTTGRMKNTSSASFLTDSPSAFSRRFKLLYENLEGQKKKLRKSFHLLLCVFAFVLCCSFCFIIEPWGIEPEVEAATVELTPENAYFIDNLDGTYDIYYNGCYSATVTQIFDKTLKVYSKDMELPAYEKNY